MTDVLSPVVLEGMEQFLSYVTKGSGPMNAAIAVGWSLRQLRELLSDPGFQQAMEAAQERRIENVEQVAYDLAFKGNVPMIQMILYCHGADRGWKPATQRVSVQHGGVIAVEKLAATKAALLEIMRENGPEVLAIGGPLDADVVEAEVVTDAQ